MNHLKQTFNWGEQFFLHLSTALYVPQNTSLTSRAEGPESQPCCGEGSGLVQSTPCGGHKGDQQLNIKWAGPVGMSLLVWTIKRIPFYTI